MYAFIAEVMFTIGLNFNVFIVTNEAGFFFFKIDESGYNTVD